MDQTTSQIYKRLISYVGDYKLIAFFAIVGMIGYSAMDALFINLMKPFIDEGLNQVFKFKNPNATGECGCGESFSV